MKKQHPPAIVGQPEGNWRNIPFSMVEIGEYFYDPNAKDKTNSTPLYKLSDWEVFDVATRKILPANYDKVVQSRFYITDSPRNTPWVS